MKHNEDGVFKVSTNDSLSIVNEISGIECLTLDVTPLNDFELKEFNVYLNQLLDDKLIYQLSNFLELDHEYTVVSFHETKTADKNLLNAVRDKYFSYKKVNVSNKWAKLGYKQAQLRGTKTVSLNFSLNEELDIQLDPEQKYVTGVVFVSDDRSRYNTNFIVYTSESNFNRKLYRETGFRAYTDSYNERHLDIFKTGLIIEFIQEVGSDERLYKVTTVNYNQYRFPSIRVSNSTSFVSSKSVSDTVKQIISRNNFEFKYNKFFQFLDEVN